MGLWGRREQGLLQDGLNPTVPCHEGIGATRVRLCATGLPAALLWLPLMHSRIPPYSMRKSRSGNLAQCPIEMRGAQRWIWAEHTLAAWSVFLNSRCINWTCSSQGDLVIYLKTYKLLTSKTQAKNQHLLKKKVTLNYSFTKRNKLLPHFSNS